MNILFWNVRKQPIHELLARLVEQVEANILILAEHDDKDGQLLHALSARHFFSVPQIGCRRISVFSQFEPKYFTHRRETDRYSIMEFRNPEFETVLFGLVHLSSKLYSTDTDQLMEASHFIEDIEAMEQQLGNKNTILIGDFNMDPFDLGMTTAGAIQCLSCLESAKAGSRKAKGREHSFFYNPSWNLLGDRSRPAGTYFYRDPHHRVIYWHVLDQVVLRPGIATRFDKQSLRILTEIGDVNLLDERGKPAISDHLPICFSIDLAIQQTNTGTANEELVA